MQGSLDISLDDLIRNGNKPGPHNLRARAPLSAYGPHRRFPTRGPALRPTPYSAPPPPPSVSLNPCLVAEKMWAKLYLALSMIDVMLHIFMCFGM